MFHCLIYALTRSRDHEQCGLMRGKLMRGRTKSEDEGKPQLLLVIAVAQRPGRGLVASAGDKHSFAVLGAPPLRRETDAWPWY
jgi:hypothetical protein